MAKPSPSFAGDPALVKIGEVIRRTRKERGLSQELLAVDAGADRSYMGGHRARRTQFDSDEPAQDRLGAGLQGFSSNGPSRRVMV